MTMNSSDVAELVNRIAGTASKNEKQALVKQGMLDPLFERVMSLTYNPFMRYGITENTLQDIPAAGSIPGVGFDAGTWKLLQHLSNGALSGDAAVAEITGELSRLDVQSADLLRRVMRKDLRAGFSESTINKGKKGTIPVFPYMRCTLPKDSNMASWNWALGIISQEKADGMFGNVNKDEHGSVWVSSRQGSPMPLGKMDAFEAECRRVLTLGTQTHGEFVVFKDGAALPRQESNGVLNSLISGSGDSLEFGMEVRFFAWDQIPLTAVVEKGKYEMPYRLRLSNLLAQFKAAGLVHGSGVLGLIPTRVVRTKAEGMAHYRELLKQGKEGTVWKHPDAIWRDGDNKDQVKGKLEVDVDLIAKSIVEGRAGTKNAGRPGSITMESACGQLRVDVTVKNEAMRDAIEANPEAWLQQIYKVRSNLVMEASDSSDVCSLFLPRLVDAAYRVDKSEADTLAQVRAQFEAAISAS